MEIDSKKKIIKYNSYLMLNTNPVLLYLYEDLYSSLKIFTKYNHKKYMIFNNTKISNNDKCILDWCSFTGGTINMALDSSIKELKRRNTISNDFVNSLARLKLFYKLFHPLKNEKITEMKKYSKYAKYIKNNRFIYNLIYINEILYNIYNDITKTVNRGDIKKILNDNKSNYYLCNIYLNKDQSLSSKNKSESDFCIYVSELL